MTALHIQKPLLTFSLIAAIFAITGCQPKTEQQQEPKSTTSTSQNQSHKIEIPLIQAKVVPVKLAKNKLCLEDGCTTYDFQTIQTNLPWINEYFNNRIKKIDPNAFANLADQTVKLPKDMPQDGQSTIYVRYLGQNYNLASFELFTFSYSAGAAHGMYHREYVVFDLVNKKHVTVADLINKGSESTVVERLYNYNQSWLEAHNITQDKLTLSDNFYYGNEGIVFVYSLYELASYAEGLSELTLPYDQASDVIKPEYLPSQPVLSKQ